MTKLKITYTQSENKLNPASVSVREPLVEDMIEAQKYGDNTQMSAALISLICTFDGKRLTMEEVARLPLTTFLDLSAALTSRGLLGSKELLSTLSEKAASTIRA